jgi:hypothetical protein
LNTYDRYERDHTRRQEFVSTIELAWSLTLSDYSIPNIAIVGSWFTYATIAQVLEAIEQTAEQAAKPRKEPLDSESVGRIVSSKIRKQVEGSKLTA